MSRTLVVTMCLACLLGFSVSYCAAADPSATAAAEVLDLLNFVEADGLNFPYRLFVPPGYDRHEDKLWPMVICLHGAGGDENSYLYHKSCGDEIKPYAAKRGYLIACPAAPRKDKSLLTEVAHEVVAEVRKHWKIDPARVYVTGFSQGGFGTYQLVAEHPELFAAAFPLVWTPVSNDQMIAGKHLKGVAVIAKDEKTKALSNVPLKIFVGTRDKWTPIDVVKKDVQAIRNAGGEVELYVHEGGHGGYRFNWVYDMIFDWFDAHTKAPQETKKAAPPQHES